MKILEYYACADSEEGTGGPDPSEKSQKYRVSQQFWSGSPEKPQSYQASISNVGKSSAGQRDAIKMVFRWRANDGPLSVLFGSSPLIKKKNKKKVVRIVGPPLAKLSGSAHVMSMYFIVKNHNHF